jgi:hypothetical protein
MENEPTLPGMVAKIAIRKNLLTVLNYNEQKVLKGNAECIAAGNYLIDHDQMNFYQKLERLQMLNDLNERAETKTIHVSLNFDPAEILSNEKLCGIASAYMEKIGFGDQPYLVYRHEDAGHPHIHIVSTAIKADGKRINTHNIGKNQSENARKEIEKIFGLVKAQRQKPDQPVILKPVDPKKIKYGKAETKRSISEVVSSVFQTYRFTSLPEFNAILKQYNVIADRGKEEGRIFRNNGLVYRVLDETGDKIGVPIKASQISGKPTLANLEMRFIENAMLKEPLKKQFKKELEDCLAAHPKSIRDLIQKLNAKQIFTVLRQSSDGRIYGITFVDNKNKCVFNGSDVGKAYSITGIQNHINADQKMIATASSKDNMSSHVVNEQKQLSWGEQAKASILDTITDVHYQNESVPFQLTGKKKKRKKKNNDSSQK